MYIKKLTLLNFRNYEKEKLEFYPGCNIIYGENAQGKTNIIEAIFLLCFSKGFRTQSEREIIQFNKAFTRIEGHFVFDRHIEQKVIFLYSESEGKSIYLEEKKITRYSVLIGKFPVVLLSPDDYNIISGGPEGRRRLFDMLLSQEDATYLNTLQQYNRILKQRNKILLDFIRQKQYNAAILEPWNKNLIEYGSFLIKFRQAFVSEFYPLLARIYKELNFANESIDFLYRPSIPFQNEKDIQTIFTTILNHNLKYELKRGITLKGPHRDDYVFKIDSNDLKIYGSRGQHKSLLVALKLAEFNYLKHKREETPIILLDDLFSDLDSNREKTILAILQNTGQTFITTSKKLELVSSLSQKKEYLIKQNKIVNNL
ncbi:DNA replication/repair protein RecF [candidate division KSB1 bacterium]|nr:DNA replication/repair protein RecF [candidate division KSB1 bacterium]